MRLNPSQIKFWLIILFLHENGNSRYAWLASICDRKLYYTMYISYFLFKNVYYNDH